MLGNSRKQSYWWKAAIWDTHHMTHITWHTL